MTERLKRLPRLFLHANLESAPVALDRDQANYLGNVLRLSDGDEALAFNGRDGEWLMRLRRSSKRDLALDPVRQTRAQTLPGNVHYLFAPLKSARLDYMAQKATELGASLLAPVITARTQASRVNLDRLVANAVEAAEQCNLLWVPAVAAEERLAPALAHLEPERILVFCDEDAPLADPLAALKVIKRDHPVAVLIGPEGGFDDAERRLLLARPGIVRLSLGPRVMRADTAAVAALTLVQAVCGDFAG